MNHNLSTKSATSRFPIKDDSTRFILLLLLSRHFTVINCSSADQSENFSKQECSGTDRWEVVVPCTEVRWRNVRLSANYYSTGWCWRLSDWSSLRPTTTSAEQTRPVLAMLCRQSNQLHNPLRGIILLSLRGVLTEEAAAAASISAILQVFRT